MNDNTLPGHHEPLEHEEREDFHDETFEAEGERFGSRRGRPPHLKARGPRNERPQGGSFPRDRSPNVARPQCVALVDAHFVSWLGDHLDEEPPRRALLNAWLETLIQKADFGLPLARSYWYSHQGVQDVPGQVHRWVAAEAQDSGASLVLALSRDLMALADSGACEQVLLVADDDRLLPAIDQAQMRGLRVLVLADESARDLNQLAKTEGAWAAMLRQADGRVIVETAQVEDFLWGEGELPEGFLLPRQEVNFGARRDFGRDFGREPQREPSRDFREPRAGWSDEPRPIRPRPMPPSDEEIQAARDHLRGQIQVWWTDLPELERRDIEIDMPPERGLPQDADRQLLNRLSQNLGRPLSVLEKKLMRGVAREVIVGEGNAAPGPSEPSAAEPA